MKRFGILIAGLLLGILLAYRLMTTFDRAGAQSQIPPHEKTVIEIVPLVDGVAQETHGADLTVTVAFDKTADLPERAPDAWGVLLDQSAHSYLISPNTTRLVDGNRTCRPAVLEKETEILATESTRFFEDTTDFGQAEASKDPNKLYVQQVLQPIKQPGTLPECASMLIWGERQGDLLIADIILYHDELR